jgi:hypothetical protein
MRNNDAINKGLDLVRLLPDPQLKGYIQAIDFPMLSSAEFQTLFVLPTDSQITKRAAHLTDAQFKAMRNNDAINKGLDLVRLLPDPQLKGYIQAIDFAKISTSEFQTLFVMPTDSQITKRVKHLTNAQVVVIRDTGRGHLVIRHLSEL